MEQSALLFFGLFFYDIFCMAIFSFGHCFRWLSTADLFSAEEKNRSNFLGGALLHAEKIDASRNRSAIA